MAKVGIDWRIQFEKACYSVPYRFISHEVLVCATPKTVRIFNDCEEIAVHTRATHMWQHCIVKEHGPPKAEEYLASSCQGLLMAAFTAGPHIGLIAKAILDDRAFDSIRPLRGLIALQKQFPKESIDAVCEKLLIYGIISYRSVKNELMHDSQVYTKAQITFRFVRSPPYCAQAQEG
ncbi:MAG: hypothetical protein ABFC21_09040 [Rectinema sp.]